MKGHLASTVIGGRLVHPGTDSMIQYRNVAEGPLQRILGIIKLTATTSSDSGVSEFVDIVKEAVTCF